MFGTRPTPLHVGAAVTALVLVAAGVGYRALVGMEILPRIGFAPGWSMTAHDGARLTSDDLRGEVVVLTFAAERCDGPCPATAELLREVRRGLEGDAEVGDVPVRLVTVSLDADGDPERLASAASAAGADRDRWLFAGADTAALRRVVGSGFGVWYERRAAGTAFDPVVVVVDGWGIVRARYRFGLPAASTLLRDVRSVAREARADGPGRYVYEAAHLFGCYATTAR